MITVVARYRAAPGASDAVAEALAAHVAATRREPACAQFVAYRSRSDPDHFLLYEQYLDEQGFASHRQSPHFRRYVEQTILPLLMERTWSVYEEIAAADG